MAEDPVPTVKAIFQERAEKTGISRNFPEGLEKLGVAHSLLERCEPGSFFDTF
jgi:hypothetical protein